nr:MAG TPA: hypothetical protein [Caudoviricetes sp.]
MGSKKGLFEGVKWNFEKVPQRGESSSYENEIRKSGTLELCGTL